IRSRDDRRRRRDHSTALRHAYPRAELGEASLDRVGDPVGQVGGRSGAAVRESGDADGAVLAQPHVNSPEPATVRRNISAKAVEDADHGGGPGGGLGQVEAVGHAIAILSEVDVDAAVGRPDADADADRIAAGSARELVMHRRYEDLAGRQLRY